MTDMHLPNDDAGRALPGPEEHRKDVRPDELFFPLVGEELERTVRAALDEDRAFDDVTTIATVVSGRREGARIVARAEGVVAGGPLAAAAFRLLDPAVAVHVMVEDGSRAVPNEPVITVRGNARAILSAERVALNYMQRLSGVATLTLAYVEAVRGTETRILDTRKTTPGLRKLEKYAVRAGGGMNHRMDLAAAVLIKDNHLESVDGDIALAVRRARDLAVPGTKVEVECDRLEQVDAALAAGADVIMLDNMPLDVMARAVKRINRRAIVEASGGVRLDTVRAIAETGVDWISVGALTHSAPALDLALDFE
jgi:nicotinate-nucleotide pyrophosphorylase (carboxylating)